MGKIMNLGKNIFNINVDPFFQALRVSSFQLRDELHNQVWLNMQNLCWRIVRLRIGNEIEKSIDISI